MNNRGIVLVLVVVVMSMLILGGCSTSQGVSLQDAQDACFSGEVATYQSVTQEQRVNVVCK